MPPRNLLVAIALGALATLAHPFAFIRRFVGPRHAFARSKVDTGRWTPELLKRLEWRRFEELCAAYFEALGFRADLAGAGADGGAVINLYEEGSASTAILVQCSPWNPYRVGIKPVRGLHGAMTSGNVGEGVLVTSGKFTREARDFADQQRISLIDGDELVAEITALLPEKALVLLKLATQGDFRTPTCPSCVIKMIPRRTTAHGRTYWGCRNYPGCKHTFYEPS
jgi:restriction system protein